MKNISGSESRDYGLVPVTEEYLQTMHYWQCKERDYAQYTCRPVKPLLPFTEYAVQALRAIREGIEKTYLLVDREDPGKPLGNIKLFDFNPRNHSAEFGYYLPQECRGKGLGTAMLGLFLEEVFSDQMLGLNKVYATTSSHNVPSMKLLEKFGFVLEGRLREHYWLGERRFDQVVYSMLRREYFV